MKQRSKLQLKLPVLDGAGLKLSYGVEATPKFVVIDAKGMVKGSYVGWGPETPASIRTDLGCCETARMPRDVPREK